LRSRKCKEYKVRNKKFKKQEVRRCTREAGSDEEWEV
jgi:hypothetical protein